MKIAIYLLLTFGAVLGQDTQNVYQQHPQEAQRRSSISYATSIVHGDKEGHAQSSVKVNLNSAHGSHQQAHIQPHTQQSYIKPGITYSQPDPIHVMEPQHNEAGIQYQQDKPHSQQIPGDLQYQGLKQSTEDNTALYYQGIQQQYHGQTQSPTQASYLQMVVPKNIYQFSTLQPQSTHQTPTIVQKNSQPQLYNVGYSINIENSAPKLTYRLPNAQTANSYRQQKLLNGDVITGTRKDKVEKPFGLNQVSYETKSGLGEVQFPTNYIAISQKQPQQVQIYDQSEKPQATKVYSDVRNTHGYTWKNLSPGVEISGYHSLESPLSYNQQTQSHTFDHAAALGRSQGFDISNVVENGNTQYHPISSGATSETQSSDISKTIAAPATSTQYQQQSSSSDAGDNNQDLDISKLLETAASNVQQPHTSSVGQSQNVELPKLADVGTPQYQPVASPLKSSQLSHSLDNSQSSFNFPSLHNSGIDLFNYHSNPFRHNLVSGSNIEFDKSLLDNFYKNYKPAFYSPEVTLPSPQLPSSINLDLRYGAGQQNSIHLPNFDYKFKSQSSKFGGLNNQFQVDPQLMMINQHYAFSQAEGLDSQQPQAMNFVQSSNSDVKPVKESQDDYQGEHSEQQPIIQEVNEQKDEVQKEKPLAATSHVSITSSGHKKYYPAGNAVLPRPYGPRALMYVPDKMYRVRTNLRPPPMIVIHQKY